VRRRRKEGEKKREKRGIITAHELKEISFRGVTLRCARMLGMQ
jgi:hypothetical protein